MTSEQPPEWVKAPDHPDDWSARIVRQPPAVGAGIVAFIEARLAEREADARLAGGDRWTLDGGIYRGHPTEQVVDWVYDDAWQHIARNDPRRVLAEVAKDRAILALHRPEPDQIEHPVCEHDLLWYPCQTVRLLAAIDADHPDYDPDWKPVAT